MTKDRVYAYVRKLQGMVRRVREAEASLDDCDAAREMLAATDPARALKMAAQVVEGRHRLVELEATVLKESKRQTMASADELVTDIAASLELVEQAYAEWRMALQQFDLNSRDDKLTDVESRSTAQVHITALKTRYEHALAVASDLVPSAGVVLL